MQSRECATLFQIKIMYYLFINSWICIYQLSKMMVIQLIQMCTDDFPACLSWNPQASLKGGRVFPTSLSESLSCKWIARKVVAEGARPWMRAGEWRLEYMISFTQLTPHEQQHTSRRGDAPQVPFWDIFFIPAWLFPFPEETQCWIYVKRAWDPTTIHKKECIFSLWN